MSRCIKCNAPLRGSMVDSERQRSEPTSSSDSSEPINSTLREPSRSDHSAPRSDGAVTPCPKCGYPVRSNETECPMCHAKLGSAPAPDPEPAQDRAGAYAHGGQSRRGDGTINPWERASQKSTFSLQPVVRQDEDEYKPQVYKGEEVVLNRSNTDPDNPTITSREQAKISKVNGEWYIEDLSPFHTTMIRVRGQVKLEDGDMIAMGDRLFVFKKG